MEKKPDFKLMMNERGNLIQITPEWRGQGRIPKGALIGFMGLTSEPGIITAAYPFWREVNNQVQFVLYQRPGEPPTMDNDYFTSDNLYINADPIIVEVDDEKFTTFGDALGQMFGKPAVVHTNFS